MALPNWLPTWFPTRIKPNRKCRRAARLRAETLEDRVTPAYTMTLAGTTATVTADDTGNTLIVTAAGGLLQHNRFAAGDPGFNSASDWDSTAAGDQTLAAAAGSVVNISQGAGTDALVLGGGASPASSLVARFVLLTAGGGGADTVLIDDGSNPAANTIVYNDVGTAGSVTGTGIDFSIETIATGGITVRTGSGDDTVLVLATYADANASNPATFTSTGGTDAVTVGDAGSTADILAPVTVVNPPAFTTLTVNSSAATDPQTVTMTGSSLTGASPAAINFVGADIGQLTVLLGSGGNTVTVLSTIGQTTVLDTGAGDDTVTVTDVAGGAGFEIEGQDGADVVTVSSLGSLQNIRGAVRVSNLNAQTAVVVDHSTSSLPAAFNTSQTGGGDLLISGLIGNGGTITLADGQVSSLTVNGGTANDLFGIDYTVPGRLNTFAGGSGADQFTVAGATVGTGSLNKLLGGGGADSFRLTSVATTAVVTIDGGADADTLTGPAAATNWTITGADAGQLDNIFNTFAAVENLVGGAGNDKFSFADGAGVTGTVAGGAGTNALDYSAYTTGVAVNLGLGTDGLAATLDSAQEVPSNGTPATGTATLTYNAAARTFDVSVTVSDLDPASVVGFHLHRGLFGVNGPVIVDFVGLAPLVPSGTGFTFTATNVALPAINESAFLSGVTYINIHTGAFPGGVIRGQVFSNGNVALASGTATGTGGVTGIQNVTGGSAADSLVGSAAANVLTGGAGNDTLLGGPGADTLVGGADDDVITWSNGDGSDVIDGGDGADTVNVNGAVAAGDVFTVGAGAGGRVAFARTNLGPFTLDIGTTERLIVTGVGGNDTFTVGDLSTVTGLVTVNLNGLAGDDTFNVRPDATVTISVTGGNPLVAPGDVLTLDALNQPVVIEAGKLTAGGLLAVPFVGVETVNLVNAASVSVAGTAAADDVVLAPTGASTAKLTVNGASYTLTGLTDFTFNGNDGNDTFTLDLTAGALAGPVTFNGGGQTGLPGDTFVTFGGTFATGVVTPTGADSGTIQYSGAGLITFTGLEPVTDLNVVTDYTINATNAAEVINVLDGPVVLGTQTGQVNSGTGTFELVNFANKTNVRVDALDGADTMTVVPFATAIPGLVSLTLAGGAGDDTFQVGGFQAAGVLTTVDGGGGPLDLLSVTDFANAGNSVYTVTPTTIARDFTTGPITYTGLGTGGPSLLLFTGNGNNTINVTGTSVITQVVGGTGADTINVSSDAPFNTGTLDDLNALLVVDSGNVGGLDVLNVSNRGSAEADAVLVDNRAGGAGIQGTAGGGWSVAFAAGNLFGGGINILLGSGGNTVDVASTLAGEPVNLFTGTGNDAAVVRSTSSPVAVEGDSGTDTVLVGNAGSVQAVSSPVAVSNFGGFTDLTLDNSADPTGRFVDVVADGAGNIVVTGLAPAAVTAVEADLNSLTVSAGTGNDTFFIDRSVPGKTSTFNGGAGADTFFVNFPTLGAGSTVALDGQPGTDAAFLTASQIAQAFTDPALGPPAVRFADSANTAGVTLTSIETVTLSSATESFELLGDRGGVTPEADLITVTGTGANSAAATINGSAPFTLAGVSDLRVRTFALDDTLKLTPFATPVQPWLVAVTADLGGGADTLDYTNAAGVFDDVTITGVGPGAGRVSAPGIGSGTSDQVVAFTNTETLFANANLGDGDKVRIALPDFGAEVRFHFSPDRSVPDVVMPGLFDINLDTSADAYEALTVDGSPNVDDFVLDPRGAAGGPAGGIVIPITVNGGPPNDSKGDFLRIIGNAGLPDQFLADPGADDRSGTVQLFGTDDAEVSFTGIEQITFDGGGGAGDDTLRVVGTAGADSFTLVETAGAAGAVSVSGQPAMLFTGFGTGAGTALFLNGLGGDDAFSVTTAVDFAIANVFIDGGPPSASDTLVVTGTAADEAFVFTPSTRVLTVTRGATVTYTGANIEVFVADGAGGVNSLTVPEFMTGKVTLPNGTLGTNPRLDYLNMTAVVVNQVPVAVADDAVTAEDTPVTVVVLANDQNLADVPLTVTVVTQPTFGTVVVNPDNTVTYTPNKNANGFDAFIYRVADANDEGSNAIVTVTVTAVNDGPTLTVPGPLTVNEDALLPIPGLSVADVDAGTNDLTVTLSVGSGRLTVLGGAGNGTATVTFTGTVAATNAALATATYQGNPNFFGPDTLTVTVTDNGNTGTGGPLTATGTVAITVVAVADAPTLTVTTPASGFEAVAIPLAVTAALTDPTEILSITISGVSAGTRFNTGVDGGTTWTFTPAQLAGLTVTVPDGPLTLNLLVTATSATGVNGSTASTTAPLVVTVANTNPTGTLANSGPVAEGSGATVTFVTAADPSVPDTTTGFRYAFDFDNDGTFDLGTGTYAGSAISPTAAVPANLLGDGPGTRVVRGRVIDKDGGFADVITTITITNVAPTATFGATGPVAEGSTGTVTFTNASDPSTADTVAGLRYAYDFNNDGVFDLGDGTYANSGTAAVATVPAAFLADGPGTRVVRGRVIDKDGGFTDYTTTITVTNVAPTATLSNAGPVAEGGTTTVTFAGQADPSAPDVAAGFRYAFDFNDDGVFEVGDGTYAGSSANPAATVPAAFLADGPATRVVRGRVIDKDGGFTDYRTVITITNAVPSATLTNAGPVNEGGTTTVAFSTPTDPSAPDVAAGFRYAFDFNDDGVFEVGDGTYAGSSANPAATVPAAFLADGPATRVVRGRVIDKDGGFTESTTTIAVNNVAPKATLSVDPRLGGGQPAVVRFTNPTDPSAPDVAAGFRYSFDTNNDGLFEVADGTSPSFTVTTPVTGQVVRGRITDKDGGFTDYTATLSADGGVGVAQIYAVGAGVGGGPVVKVYNADGSLRAAFFAYEATFRGGVHVAVGDVTGDGVADIVAGAGLGGGPVVKVFDGVTLGEIASFFAYESTFRGGVEVAVGDVDGDGRGEVITGSGDGGGPLVKVFTGRGELRSGFLAYEKTFRGGVPVAAGDVDGDGKAEIVTGAGVGGGPLVKVFAGTTNQPADTGTSAAPLGAFFAYETNVRSGVRVAVGNIDGLGGSEIITAPGFGGSPLVKAFGGAGFTTVGQFQAFDATLLNGQPNRGGASVAARDINGDGRAEILASNGPGLAPRITFRDGLAFTEIKSDVPFEADFLGGLFVG